MGTKTSPSGFSHIQDEQPFLDEITIQQNPVIPPRTIYVQKYQPGHREAVRRICCDTGFLGRPIDHIYRDRELFADLLTKVYLDYEPEWTLVAESQGQVMGYLLGSLSSRFKRSLMFRGFQTSARMLARWLTGIYADHPRSGQFVRWVLTKGLWELPKHPENAPHLHMNLCKSCRGGLVAKRLLILFEDMLWKAGVEKYYAQFFSCSERHPMHVYYRYGFTFFDQCVTTIFQPEYPNTLSIVCLEKRLTGEPLRK
jgi:hypothetical protein